MPAATQVICTNNSGPTARKRSGTVASGVWPSACNSITGWRHMPKFMAHDQNWRLNKQTMLKIEEMAHGEMLALLLRAAYGHLACARDNRPYVVPMNYTFDLEFIYFFTTEGTKTEMIEANNTVCFQVEEVTDPQRWRSVMVTGQAERLTRTAEVEHAM